jgi:streptogramin lyase
MSAKRFLLVSLALACLQFPPIAAAQTFITAWGSYGSGNGQLKTPQGVAVGGSGEVYVSDGDNGRIQVFTSSGAYLRQWSVPEITPGTYDQALDIAVDANDNVYVAAVKDHLIYRYTSTGTVVTQWGGFGSGPGQFGFGLSVAVDASGNVYANDNGNARVQVFTPLGVFVRQWGALGPNDGQFQSPDGVAVDAAGNVYVADYGNYRVQKFTSTGTFLLKWGSLGTGNGQFGSSFLNGGPVRLAVGPEGNVYAVDHANSRVEAFTGDGTFLTKWGSPGSSPGLFLEPIGIAVDAYGNIYVADKNNSRIQKFRFVPTRVQGVTWGGVKARYRAERGGGQHAPQNR